MTDMDAPDSAAETTSIELELPSKLLEHVLELRDQLRGLENKVDEQGTYDAIRDKQITQLSELVDTYKTGLAFPFLRSFALEIHRIREGIVRYVSSDALNSATAIAKEVELFILELDEALINQGFSRLSSVVGSPFDAAHHRASKPVPSADLALDGVIASSQKAGLLFQRPDGSWITVIPETVEVYKYTPAITGATA